MTFSSSSDPAEMLAADRWCIGPVEVDVASLQISCDEEVLTTEVTQVRTLMALIKAYPGIVDKDALIEQAWGGRIVSDAAVHKTISLLRRTLKLGGVRDCIETRHRLGYRLAIEPVPQGTPMAPAKGALSPPRRSFGPVRWLATGGATLLVLLAASLLLDFGDRESRQLTADAGLEHTAAALETELADLEIGRLLDIASRSIADDPGMAEQALMAADGQLQTGVPPDTAGMLAKQWGMLHYHQGRLPEAIEQWRRALVLFEQADNRLEMANVMANLGAAHEELGDDEIVDRFLRRALTMFVQLEYPEGQARALNNRIEFLLRRNRLEEARADIDQLHVLAQALDGMTWQARAALHEGDWAARMPNIDALPFYQSAHDQFRADGALAAAASAAQRIARVLQERDLLDDGLIWLERARRHLESAGLFSRLPVIDYAMAINHERRGDRRLARIYFQSAIDGLEPGLLVDLRIDAEVGLARLDINEGMLEQADRRLHEALRVARINDRPSAEASVLIARGFASLLDEDGASAAIDAARTARERLGLEPINWSHERNLLALETLAQIADGRYVDAERSTRQLRLRADELNDAQTLKQADFADAARLFAEGRFPQAYRFYRRVTDDPGQSLHLDRSERLPPASGEKQAMSWLYLPLVLLVGMSIGWFTGRRPP